MKVAKLYSFNDIRIEDIPLPKIGPRDALIRTKACGICSGDVMPWYIEKKAPLVLGHEPVGEIVELGKEVRSSEFGVRSRRDLEAPSPPHLFTPSFKVGDRVFVHHHAPCMECRHCKRGDYVQCDTWRNTKIIPGGISEYILIPEINLRNDTLLLSEGVNYEDGTLIEPAACVVKSFRRSGIKKGDTLLVIGLGVMGQMHVLLAREYGAAKVIGADMVQFRLNKALEFGADHVIDVSKENNPPSPPAFKSLHPPFNKGGMEGLSGDILLEKLRDLTNGFMADVVVVGPNSADAMKQGIKAASRGGTVVFFTPAKPDELLTINPNEVYFRDISLITSYSCGPDDTRRALQFIEKGVVRADKLITHRFPIGKTMEAFKLTSQTGDSLKSVIVF